jgi:RimJ/RimL family protein N-acetyltransferase
MREFWHYSRQKILGQGYGTEAVLLTLRYGFRGLNLHRIQLGVYAYNERAIRCYRKTGFREEGRRREAYSRNGEWHDHVLMAILAREYFESAEF